MSDALAMRLIQALPAGVARLFSQGARGAVEHSKRRRIDLIDSGSSALDRK
jgi:hypothetical protein